MTMPGGKTAAEILTERKTQLFASEIEESKRKQELLITQCNNGIDYSKAQITKLEALRQNAQDLLDELNTRYPEEEAV